jgi:hypothetical protein
MSEPKDLNVKDSVSITEIEYILKQVAADPEHTENAVVSSTDKFFQDCNVSMMGGWT